MDIIEPGHVYLIHNVDGDGTQEIRFVRRRDDNAVLLPDGSRAEGILSQELFRVLIDRTLYLNAEEPCAEDIEIVLKLRECLKLYEARSARRTIEKISMPEREDVCPQCHHILCLHNQESRQIHPERKHG